MVDWDEEAALLLSEQLNLFYSVNETSRMCSCDDAVCPTTS